MATYETVIEVGHAPADMFALVSDVRRYPGFVRWIKGMRVDRERIQLDETELVAEAIVGFQGLTERFTTRVRANAVSRRVLVSLVDGPFRRLENSWTFSDVESGSGTRIAFHIEYKFKNPVLQLLLVTNFDKAVDRLMQSFLDEADRRHGPKPWRVAEVKRAAV